LGKRTEGGERERWCRGRGRERWRGKEGRRHGKRKEMWFRQENVYGEEPLLSPESDPGPVSDV
jgi:hypothetical protein